MNRYLIEEKIGEGAFGTVYRAKKKGDHNKLYAVKKLKQRFSSWKDVLNEREFQAMVALTTNQTEKNYARVTTEKDEDHQNWNHSHEHYLVRVNEILREQNSSLYFVMEHMGSGSLHDYISQKSRQALSRSHSEQNDNYVFDNSEIRSILFQAFRGLCHVHWKGLVHRDIKPENILLEGRKVKLADFSLARPITAKSIRCPTTGNNHSCDEENIYTNYVGTRWYRAPELLRLGHNTINTINRIGLGYTTSIDVFSMGCVAAELYRCLPLFRGRDEQEQLQLIEELLLVSKSSLKGTDEFLLRNQDVSEQAVEKRLKEAIPTTDPLAIPLLYNILQVCPHRRANTESVLYHSYFEREYNTATGGKKNKEHSTFASAMRPRRATHSSAQTIFPSNEESIQDSRNQFVPQRIVAPSSTGVGNTKFQIYTIPPVRITPTAACSVGSKGYHRFSKVRDKRIYLTKESPINSLKIDPQTRLYTPKRQKLRASKIFNID